MDADSASPPTLPPPLQLYRAPNVTGPYTYLLDIPSGGTPGIFEDGFLFQVRSSHARWRERELLVNERGGRAASGYTARIA